MALERILRPLIAGYKGKRPAWQREDTPPEHCSVAPPLAYSSSEIFRFINMPIGLDGGEELS